MWSSHDYFLGHKGRYTVYTLSRVIKDAGLKIDRVNCYYAGVFPFVFIVKNDQQIFCYRFRDFHD